MTDIDKHCTNSTRVKQRYTTKLSRLVSHIPASISLPPSW